MNVEPFFKLKYLLPASMAIICSLCSDLPTPILEINSAYENLLSNKLILNIADAEIGVKSAERWQAEKRPNPNLIFELEDLGRSGDSDENELFLGVAQLIERGGKRSARIRVAEAELCATNWDIAIARTDLYINLLHAFISVSAAQERLALSQNVLNNLREIFEITCCKVEAGKESKIEFKKAEIAIKTADLQYIKNRAALNLAKQELSSLWDSCPPTFECVDFPLYDLSPTCTRDQLVLELETNPLLAKSQAEMAKAWEVIELEYARAVPDVAVQVGVSTESFFERPAFCFGIQIPLPVFDRNEANICRAEHIRNQFIYKHAEMESRLKNQLTLLHEKWSSSYEHTSILCHLINHSFEVFEDAKRSYEEGKINYSTLLEARNKLFELEQEYLVSLEEYHHRHADILKLVIKCPEFDN